MKVAIVGATGLVGSKMLQVLEERKFPITELVLAASEKSVGKILEFKGQKFRVESVESAIQNRPDIALFSAGGQTSIDYAPAFAKAGSYVIDNSSAWRMDASVPLVIPEINARSIKRKNRIIANPNCSTIQMLMVLAPLHKAFKISRVVVSTYQSITGTGVKAIQQLDEEEKQAADPQGLSPDAAYPHPIYRNCLPHCDDFLDNGYTKEEMKLVNETRKILDDESIRVTATAVRVPVVGGHSESINLEFKRPLDLVEARVLLKETAGVEVLDDPAHNLYPMPILAHESDLVYVGRIRQDFSCDRCLNLWVVADNLRKGAATNAVQIAEYLARKKYVR